MPAKSKKQQKAMAIAEHHPEKLYKRNRKLKKLSKRQLHEFSSTSIHNLPNKVSNPRKGTKKSKGKK